MAKIIKFTSPDSTYWGYRISILEEAEEILSNKKKFIELSHIKTKEKILKLQEISDFFYLEEEYELSNEFNSISKAIQIKKILKI